MTVLAVSTGVVVIVVVIGIVATALIVAVAMRGRDRDRRADRRELDDVHERAGRVDRDTARGIGKDPDR